MAMRILAPGQSWRSAASFRQTSVLERLGRDIALLHNSPAAWAEELYKDLGPDGIKKCLERIEEAKKSSGYASAVIDVYLNRSLTMTIKFLLTDEVNERD